MIRSLVALLSLAALAWTPLPTSVSPEVRLAAPLPVPTVHSAGSAAASDGRGFFVVSVVSEYGGGFDQVGMLLDEEGRPALAQSARIDDGTGDRAAVASSGRNYLAVWHANGSTLGARFTLAGERIDHEPIVIRAGISTFDIAPDPGPELGVSWNGTHYVVVSDDGRGGFFGALVDEDGSVVRDDLQVSGNRIASLNGVSVTINAPMLASGASDAQIAAGGDGFFVVYRRGRDVYGQELDAAGNVRVAERLIAREGFEPAVGWNGAHWVVAFVGYEGDDPLHVIRLGVDDAPVKIAERGTVPSLASSGSRALLTWRQSFYETRTALIDDTSIRHIGPAQRYPGDSSAPALARIGDVTLTAWMESGTVAPEWQLRIQPIRNGVPQPARTISSPILGGILDFTSNGSEALLVVAQTHQTERIRFLRLSADGTVLSDSAINARPGFGTVRWMGTQYLFVWRAIRDERFADVSAVRISATGEAIGTPLLLISGNAFEMGGGQLAVAGDRALAVWTFHQQGFVEGVILDSDLAATPIQRFDFPGGEGSPLDVASDGVDFLVARVRRAQDDTLIWQRVLRDGTSGAAGSAPIGPRSSYAPYLNLLWTGENYLSIVAREETLFGHRIAPNGDAIDAAAARISAAPGLYSWTVTAQYTELGRVELAYLAPPDAAALRHGVVFRTLGPPRRRSVR